MTQPPVTQPPDQPAAQPSNHGGPVDGTSPWADDGFATKAIHAGQEPEERTGAVAVPIFQTSTYAQDQVGITRAGYDYSRAGNPTRTALEEALSALENGRHTAAFASGMAAADAALRALLRPGDHLIIPIDAYGGTFRLIDKIAVPWGVSYTAVPLGDTGAVRAALRPETKLIWCETPTNPLLGIADIAALADIAHGAPGGAKLLVDNTFATAYLQQPLELGADVVLHSTTKYIGGHSDVIGGSLTTADDEIGEQFAFHAKSMGGVAGPFDSWLTLRGVKTLAVRMDRHCDNAEQIVELLTENPKVGTVYYPGLPEHPGHQVAARQMRRFGGMVSFRVRGGQEEAVKICSRTRLFTLGESLGGVESLIEVPALMTHMSVAGSELEVPADLIRISVGIEDIDDLMTDLADALA
ncbi:cystathionine gamma-synthase [Nakamurella aerolata]|uniref:Cystathionine gamma-synthase n=1 Tax=Nakamurella aerolata TaxID=1656892 RepID=A0A849A3T8_9ACTN|nr:cystathionine gamma-synthase [Nakamurella aerolata]NNG35269.1 cystathionine gamma-synthase [Nakamurella aerolata]